MTSSTGFFNYQLKLELKDHVQDNLRIQFEPTEENYILVQVQIQKNYLQNYYFENYVILQLDLFFNTFQYFNQVNHQMDLRYDMQKFVFFAQSMPRLPIPRILDDLNDVDFHWTTPHSAYEIYQNANSGSLFAQLYLYQHLYNSLKIINHHSEQYPEKYKKSDLIEFVQFIQQSYLADHLPLNSLNDVLLKLADKMAIMKIQSKKDYYLRLKKYELRKSGFSETILEAQLAALVKNNDRLKVAEIIETILPWEVFEPSESLTWKNYVDSIRNPQLSDSFVMYRGSDKQDKLQLVFDSENNVKELGIFAKKITSGSGSHVHRILDIPHLLERTGVLGNMEFIPPYQMPHTLSAMVTNHSINPFGSLFISWSISPDIAFRFLQSTNSIEAKPKESIDRVEKKYLASSASGAVIAAIVDRRRLFINAFSGYRQELEVLVPLIVFPDEIIHFEKGLRYAIFQNGNLARLVNRSVQDFTQEVQNKITSFEQMPNEPKQQSQDIYRSGQRDFFNLVNGLPMSKNTCEQVFH